MSRTRRAMSAVNSSASRKARSARVTVPLLGVAPRFGGARAHRTSIALATSMPLHVAQRTRCVGAGCPSFGGQRTVWFALKKRCVRPCSTAISSSKPSAKTNSQQPGVRSVAPHCRTSLALRLCAAPGRWGRAGTGFARATSAGAFGQRMRAAVVARDGVRPSNGASNPSIERTHNGGPRLLASSPPAAPLCAAHVKLQGLPHLSSSTEPM
jgi:hypothetical protein